MTKQTFTVGQVAAAIHVPRPTLLSWTQRGHFPFLNDRMEGEAREFNLNEVAYTAAFAVLARCGGGDAMGAAKMMQEAIDGQRPYWQKAINDARKGKSVYILAKRYIYRGLPQIDAEVHVGDGLQSHLDAFENPIQEGALIGSDDEPAASADHVAFAVSVGRAIASALKSLS